MNNNESTQNQYTNDEILTKINAEVEKINILNIKILNNNPHIIVLNDKILRLTETLRVKLKEEDNG